MKKTTKPFSNELMGYIKEGQIQRERFNVLTEEIIKSSKNDNSYPFFWSVVLFEHSLFGRNVQINQILIFRNKL